MIKNNKNVSKKTLDTHHSDKIKGFLSKEDKIKKIQGNKSVLQKQLGLYDKRKSELTDEEFEKYISLQDEITLLNKELQNVEKTFDEINYYINAAPILFKYYDILEKGNHNEENKMSLTSNSILKYFIPKQEITVVDKPDVNKTDDRATLLDKYMYYNSENYFKEIESDSKDKCLNCSSSNRNIMLNDGLIFCNDCCTIENIIIDHDRPSYKDPPKEISYFAYKRINHFNEWISQIQGKEQTDINPDIYDAILVEIKKQKIINMADLTHAKIKEILKKLKINKYYEHAPHIINKLNGMPIPHFEPDLEEKLRTMFKLIQPPFLKYAPPERKNFLSYSYCIHKMVQLLGRDEYLPNFPLLKSREKLHQQDVIWKKICEELKWSFYPSL